MWLAAPPAPFHSMYPLLFKDGLAIPYVACQVALVVGIWSEHHVPFSLATVCAWNLTIDASE